jgi:hypothetical protein
MAWENAGRVNGKPAYICLNTDEKLSGDVGGYLYEFNASTDVRTIYQNIDGTTAGWKSVSTDEV